MGSKCVFLNSLPHPAPRRALPTMIKTNILCYLLSVLCYLFSVLWSLKNAPVGRFLISWAVFLFFPITDFFNPIIQQTLFTQIG